jgi:ankyrin repeat protein
MFARLLSIALFLSVICGCYAVAKYTLNDLSDAAAKGDIVKVQNLLKKGNNVNDKDKRKPYATALHWAARDGHIEVVKTLLAAGADVNARDFYKETPLYYAIDGKSTNSLEITKLLIDKGADVNAHDDSDQTPLESSIYVNSETGYEIAKLLIAKGSKTNKLKDSSNGMALLHFAASYGQVKMVQLLLDNGADINAIEPECQQTPLIAAISQRTAGGTETAKLLIVRGADIEAIDCADWNALDHAKAAKNNELIGLLVSKSKGKAKIDDPNFQGTSSQNSYSNLASDLNRDYTIFVNLNDYTPKLDPVKYMNLKGKKICMSNIKNESRFTSNFSYYSKDRKVRYQLAKENNAGLILLQSYFWYAYQKAFEHIGIEATDNCSQPDLPELWIIFQSFSDERLKLKITVLKNGKALYEKDLLVKVEMLENRDYQHLQKRAYEMIDLTVASILDDSGFQANLLK